MKNELFKTFFFSKDLVGVLKFKRRIEMSSILQICYL